MYKRFYGLTEHPFNMTPDPQFLYRSRSHRIALDVLEFGIRERKGFIVLTGEVGTGKTTVCRSLLKLLDPSTRTALILNPTLSETEMLQCVCDEFQLKPAGVSKKNLFDAINAFLLAELAANHNVVLIVDEAQHLAPSVLEEIRLLSNLETDKEKLLQIVLAGQPELDAKLRQENLRQLRQRVALRHAISPIGMDELIEYIRYRWHRAGGDDRLQWTPGALLLIHKFSRGLPRLINIICDRALMAAYVNESLVIDPGTVQLAIEDAGCELPAAMVASASAAEVATR
jgi:general secretion pathway protein A